MNLVLGRRKESASAYGKRFGKATPAKLSSLGVVSQQALTTIPRLTPESHPRVGDFAEGLATASN